MTQLIFDYCDSQPLPLLLVYVYNYGIDISFDMDLLNKNLFPIFVMTR